MRVTAMNISRPNLTYVDMHAHDRWELVVFMSGEGVHRVGELEIPFRAGTIVCQPPRVPHGTDSACGWQDMYVQLAGYEPPSDADVPVYQDDAQRQFTQLLRFCLDAFRRQDSDSLRLADRLMEAAQQLMVVWSRKAPRDALVDEFLSRLNGALGDANLDVSDLIRRTGYCSDAFRRRFRAATGTTPTAYLIDRRIDHACALLQSLDGGSLSIRQIASLCGFDDPYYFSTMFRRRMGCSPSDYRKKKEP